jgi:hypothetical protein
MLIFGLGYPLLFFWYLCMLNNLLSFMPALELSVSTSPEQCYCTRDVKASPCRLRRINGCSRLYAMG